MTSTERLSPPIPNVAAGVVVVDAPGSGPGWWAGGPSAVSTDDAIYLAYRLRRPVGEGRGFGCVVAKSTDGEHFETILELSKDDFASESLERPALALAPDGTWKLYISSATPGTLHWRVDALEAADPAGFDPKTRTSMLPGDPATAFKDPVIFWADGLWHMWVCVHEIADPATADRMHTRYATSTDGVHWGSQQLALAGRPGAWDERGARVTSVLLNSGQTIAYYDGRARADQNWEEQTGIAFGDEPGVLRASGDGPVAVSPHHGGGLRYISVVTTPEGGHRMYYELTGPDGAHDLRTEYVPPTR